MTFPESLLQVAEQLVRLDVSGRPRQTALRRAVSTAYYALFHLLVQTAVAAMFRNQYHRQLWGPVAARDFGHSSVLRVAQNACRPLGQRSAAVAAVLGGQQISPELEQVCRTFETSQQQRELADYDVAYRVLRSEAEALVAEVRAAFEAWEVARHTPVGQAFIALLLLYGRGQGRR